MDIGVRLGNKCMVKCKGIVYNIHLECMVKLNCGHLSNVSGNIDIGVRLGNKCMVKCKGIVYNIYPECMVKLKCRRYGKMLG